MAERRLSRRLSRYVECGKAEGCGFESRSCYVDDEYVLIKKSALESLRESCRTFRMERDPLDSLSIPTPWEEHMHRISIGVYMDDYNVLSTRQLVTRELVVHDGGIMAPMIWERAVNELVQHTPAAIKGLQRHCAEIRAEATERQGR